MPRIIHFEIPSENPEASVQFYTKVFDWKIEHNPQMDYWLVFTGPKSEPGINGSITKRRNPGQPFANYIGVENIDEAIANVEANGGEVIIDKTTIAAVGYIAFFKDPDGNIMGLMQEDMKAT